MRILGVVKCPPTLVSELHRWASDSTPPQGIAYYFSINLVLFLAFMRLLRKAAQNYRKPENFNAMAAAVLCHIYLLIIFCPDYRYVIPLHPFFNVIT